MGHPHLPARVERYKDAGSFETMARGFLGNEGVERGVVQ